MFISMLELRSNSWNKREQTSTHIHSNSSKLYGDTVPLIEGGRGGKLNIVC